MSAAPPASDPTVAIDATDQVLIDELLMLESAMERNYAWVYELLAPYLGASVLEVGSGVGVMSRHLVARGTPVVLSDHHPAYLEHLRARFAAQPQVAFQLLDLIRHPYAVVRPVDTIVCLNVLEHLEDDAAVLAGLRALLPPGGRLLLQVPNYPALYGSLDETYGHFRRYNRRTLSHRLTDAGFHIVALRNFNPLAIPGWIVSAKLLRARRLDVRSARLFNTIVPLARRLDFLSRFAGLALLACAEREA
jgi:2-polyprenyl-3-methyl-5-hydroxy-6-metoxy-1,4-benzoquinol methylase